MGPIFLQMDPILVPLIFMGIVGFILIGWVLYDEWRRPAGPTSWTYR
jgi:hypothetical protein